MGAIICSVEENGLLRRITVRQYCKDEETKKVALAITAKIGEIIENMEDLKMYGGGYVESEQTPHYFSGMPIEVSYSVLYKTEIAKEKFLLLLKKVN